MNPLSCRYLAAAEQWLHFLFIYNSQHKHMRPIARSNGTGDCRRHRENRLHRVLDFLCYSRCTMGLNGRWKNVCPDWNGTTLSHWSRLVSCWSARLGSVVLLYVNYTESIEICICLYIPYCCVVLLDSINIAYSYNKGKGAVSWKEQRWRCSSLSFAIEPEGV